MKKVTPSALRKAFEQRMAQAATPRMYPARIVATPSDRVATVEFSDHSQMNVLNQAISNTVGLRVFVGYSPYSFPGTLQVIGLRPIAGSDVNAQADWAKYSVPSHHKAHELGGADTVFVQKGQLLDLLTFPLYALTGASGDEFKVQIYGDIQFNGTDYFEVPNQQVDLTSSVPASGTGARFVLFQYDSSGTVTTKDGSLYADKSLLNLTNLPLPDADNVPFYAVQLYNGQSYLQYGNPSLGQVCDFWNLRSPAYSLSTNKATLVNPSVVDNFVSFADTVGTQKDSGYNQDSFSKVWLKSADPTASDDMTAGYSKLDFWLNQSTNVIFVCADNTTSAAVWSVYSGGTMGDLREHIDGTLSTGTGVAQFLVTRPTRIAQWYIDCDYAGSAGTTIYDVNLNGTSLWNASPSGRPTLAYNDADGYAVSGTPDTVDFVAGDILTVDIDQVATGAEGIEFVGQVTSPLDVFDLTVEQSGGSPSVSNVGKIVFSGTVTDNTGGQVTVDPVPVVPMQSNYGASPSKTTTSSSYVDFDTSMDITFAKKSASSNLLVRMMGVCNCTATSTTGKFGVHEGSTDYDVAQPRFSVAGNMAFVGMALITGLSAGNHTFRPRWKRTAGSGTLTYNDASSFFYSVEEVN